MPPRTDREMELSVTEDYRLKDSDGEYVFYPVAIAEKYKISRKTLYDILARYGVPRRTTKKKPRPNLFSYSYVMSNPKLLYEMIDEYQIKKPDGLYVYSIDKFLDRNNISQNTWDKICQEKGIERRYKVSSGAYKNSKPYSKKNSVEDLEPRIHEVVEAYNLVDENGEPVYKVQKLFLKFGCRPTTFFRLLRIAGKKYNLRVNFRLGLRN